MIVLATIPATTTAWLLLFVIGIVVLAFSIGITTMDWEDPEYALLEFFCFIAGIALTIGIINYRDVDQKICQLSPDATYSEITESYDIIRHYDDIYFVREKRQKNGQ